MPGGRRDDASDDALDGDDGALEGDGADRLDQMPIEELQRGMRSLLEGLRGDVRELARRKDEVDPEDAAQLREELHAVVERFRSLKKK